MPPKLSLGLAQVLQSSQVQRVAQIQQLTQTQRVVCAQKVEQECRLCKQAVTAQRQLQESMILLEKFNMCASCFQPVRLEIAAASWYRRRWNKRVRAISKARGWNWQAF